MLHTADRSSVGGAALLLATGSALGAFVALVLSFRVPFPAFEVGLQANSGRMLAAAAAGMSFAAAAALRGTAGRALREAYVFALSIGGAAGMAIGSVFVGGMIASVALGVVGALAAMGLVRSVDGRSRFLNLGLAFVLVGLFAAAIPASLAAWAEPMGFALWLLGDVSRAHGTGSVLAFALAAGSCAWAAWHAGEEGGASPAAEILLVGLGIGIAGPVAFVGWAAASLSLVATGANASVSTRVGLAALVGAAMLMLADAVSRYLIGGYAPALNVTLGFVAIPAFLWANRRRLRRKANLRAAWAFEGFEAVFLLVIAAGLLLFANALTSFVRQLT